MRWKQFLTPVHSVDAETARSVLQAPNVDAEIIDVRQPKEYDQGHIPGAKLIPLPQLQDRLQEIDADKPVYVYCAVGGRSRVAAQMLSSQGFADVVNMKGGFKAWNGHQAIGGEEVGLELFDGLESFAELLKTAYGMEAGLREFYVSLASRVDDDDVRELFETLARIEQKHTRRVFQIYHQKVDDQVDESTFAEQIVPQALEGGQSSQDYIDRFAPDWNKPEEVMELAMGIEAQAMDLYTRAAQRESGDSREFLEQMAQEEKGHLQQLGQMLDRMLGA